MSATKRQDILTPRDRMCMLRQVLGSMRTDAVPSVSAAKERRAATRQREEATIEIRRGSGFETAPLIEYTQHGARLVLHNVTAGQTLNFVISTARRTLRGQARVAWTSPLSNGRSVAGLELLRYASVAKSVDGFEA